MQPSLWRYIFSPKLLCLRLIVEQHQYVAQDFQSYASRQVTCFKVVFVFLSTKAYSFLENQQKIQIGIFNIVIIENLIHFHCAND